MTTEQTRTTVSLDGAWSFCISETPAFDGVSTIADVEALGLETLPATVPGNLELDLHACGRIPDPFVGMNIAALRRYETFHAVYFRRFDAAPSMDMDHVLEAQGVDCYARIYLNGRLVATCDNMLVEWRVEVPSGLLRESNEIVVVFEPPIRPGDGQDGAPRLQQAMAANYESLRTRKAPHMYGWDIMPRALSLGLWRSVRIVALPRERIASTYLETLGIASDQSGADLHLHYALNLAESPLKPADDGSVSGGYRLRLEGVCGESAFREEQPVLGRVGTLRFRLDDPRLWWPRGRGDQNLYACVATLMHGDRTLDRAEFTFGVRTIRLERTDLTDAAGRGEFCFHVNGERVFVLGTNWVPLDAYHSRDLGRVDRAVALVEEIGCNAVRCWGGNVYESERFYDLCDRAGILVWQDFAMACAIYPQDAAFQDALRREARQVVRRLRQHPCVALWAGDNECDQAYGWGSSGVDPNTNVLTRQVLPEVIRQEDPRRPYLPSSPYIAPEAMARGTQYLTEDHLWGPRDDYKGPYYTSAQCHFASEIGYHGCPSPESIRRFITPGNEWPYTANKEWLLHATSPIPGVNLLDYRVELMANQVRVLFGEAPDNLDDFAFASQCSQAEAMKFFVEMFRSRKWRRTGIIWWNILDGWPQFSDAVVDYYFGRKLAFEYIRRSQAPLCVMLREPDLTAEPIEQEIVICNDTRERLAVEYCVRDAQSGETLAGATVSAGPDVVTVVGEMPHDPTRRAICHLQWSAPGHQGWNHYLTGPRPYALEWYRSVMRSMGAWNGGK
jgi:beta-mannosidase